MLYPLSPFRSYEWPKVGNYMSTPKTQGGPHYFVKQIWRIYYTFYIAKCFTISISFDGTTFCVFFLWKLYPVKKSNYRCTQKYKYTTLSNKLCQIFLLGLYNEYDITNTKSV